MKQKKSKSLQIPKYVILILGASIMLIPFIWMLSTSFKDLMKCLFSPRSCSEKG